MGCVVAVVRGPTDLMCLSKTAKEPGAPRVCDFCAPHPSPFKIPLAKLGTVGVLAVPSNAVLRLILSVLRQSGRHDSACSPTGIGSKSVQRATSPWRRLPLTIIRTAHP